MKKSLIARHNANQQVVLTLKSNELKFTAVPLMATVIPALEGLVNKTSSLFTKVESIPAKTAGNKQIARADLISIALKLSNMVKAFAFITRNENLINSLITSESGMTVRMSHQSLLDYCKNLVEILTTHAAALPDYGLTEALQTELSTEISDFETVITEPRQLISERKTTNELIEEKIEEIHTLLVNQVDPLMELFIDDQELYLSYKSARMIVDPATRSRTEEEA